MIVRKADRLGERGREVMRSERGKKKRKDGTAWFSQDWKLAQIFS